MNINAIITARSGSKGLPNKNIKELGGIPVLGWIVNAAKNSSLIKNVILSTDSNEYFEIGKSINANLIHHIRTPELAEDVESELILLDVIKKFKELFTDDSIVVLLQPTTPFTKSTDIDNCIQKLIDNPNNDTCVSVKKMTEHPEWAITSDNNTTGKCNQISGKNSIRQNLTVRWIPNGGIWVIRKEFLINNKKILNENETLFYEMEKLRSIDIDDEEDLILCRSLVDSKIITWGK